ncbi:hypothetical protein GEMRC1_012369 [Eukaryota sp. GEM-RC1]
MPISSIKCTNPSLYGPCNLSLYDNLLGFCSSDGATILENVAHPDPPHFLSIQGHFHRIELGCNLALLFELNSFKLYSITSRVIVFEHKFGPSVHPTAASFHSTVSKCNVFVSNTLGEVHLFSFSLSDLSSPTSSSRLVVLPKQKDRVRPIIGVFYYDSILTVLSDTGFLYFYSVSPNCNVLGSSSLSIGDDPLFLRGFGNLVCVGHGNGTVTVVSAVSHELLITLALPKAVTGVCIENILLIRNLSIQSQEQLVVDFNGQNIGKGGFATVYEGKWFGAPVAVKTVSLTDDGVLMLKKELSFLMKLAHPNILRVFGLCDINDKVAIVMERADHSLLTPSVLSQQNVNYAIEICHAVSFLHSQGVIHGDLKPGNILLLNKSIRIADFGTSKTIAKTTIKPSTTAITPKYAPPEAFSNKLFPASDVYSLGIIFYELLTNRIAFEDLDPIAMFGAKMNNTHLPFNNVPKELQEIITRCCSINPESRPSIDELLTFLKSLNVNSNETLNNSLVQQPCPFQKIPEIPKYRTSDSDQLNRFKVQLQNQLNSKNASLNQLNVELEQLKILNNSPRFVASKPKAQKASSYPFDSNILPTGIQEAFFRIKNGADTISANIEDNNAAFAIADALRASQTLQSLSLTIKSSGYITSRALSLEGMTALVDALKFNSSVTFFSLQSFVVSKTDVCYGDILGDLLLVNNTIQNVDLRLNLGNKGISSILSALQSNSSVTSLSFTQSHIETFGFVALADFMKANDSLKHLNVSQNTPGSEGIVAFAESLRFNNCLEVLNVSKTFIGFKAFSSLTFAKSLKILYVDLSIGSSDSLFRLVETNPNIERVNVVDFKRHWLKNGAECKGADF